MTLAAQTRPIERLPWSVSLCISLVAPATLFLGGMFFTAQLVTSSVLSFGTAFRFTLPIWLPWVVFGPLAVLLATRYPFERGRISRSVAIHLVVLAGICLANWKIMGEVSGGILRNLPASIGLPRGDKPPLSARVVIDLLAYGILVSMCHTMLWSLRAKERERRAITAEAHLAKARLSALRMQLHPHFLFNSLNGISTLVHTDPNAADDMIANLSALLRLSLGSANEQEIPLRRELDFLQCYLDIEQVRYGSRLQFKSDLSPESLTAFLPGLLLQPLIENAVRHGLAPQCRTVTISLSASIHGGMLHIQICDDGCGLPDSPPGEDEFVHGIGISNTRARLAEIYGSNQSINVRNGPADKGPVRGCIVDIRLPHHTEAIL